MIIILISILSLICAYDPNVLHHEPDFEYEEIPANVRQVCGHRYRIRAIDYFSDCFHGSHGKQLFDFRPYILGDSRAQSRVLNGRDALPYEAPWAVQLGRYVFGDRPRVTYHCSGVLISWRHILTAGHCYRPGVNLSIFVGNNRAFDERYFVTNRYVFDRRPELINETLPNGTIVYNFEYDIGLITMDIEANSINITDKHIPHFAQHMNPICMPKKEPLREFQYKPATFFGWGAISRFQHPERLQRADIELNRGVHCPEGEQCRDALWYQSQSREVWPTQGCPGDSGSGVIQYLDNYQTQAVLIGITVGVDFRDQQRKWCQTDFVNQTYVMRIASQYQWIKEVIRNSSDYFR